MISFYKKKYGLMFALVFLCGFQFFFLPFIHYHPDNTHTHDAELTPHHHQGHFHSHELETLTHFIHHEDSPSEGHRHSDNDGEHHHSDPFDDTKNLNLHKPKLVKGTSVVKNAGTLGYSPITNLDSSSFFIPDKFSQIISGPPKIFLARSPPAFLI